MHQPRVSAPAGLAAHPADRLAVAIDTAGTIACVGLDPVLDRLPAAIDRADPAAAIETFCAGVLEAVTGVVGVVKPQAACFERFGSAGYRAMEQTIDRARRLGFFVILDAKRGDIGSTSAHYAAGAAAMGADAITVNPYLGPSGIEPFLDAGLAVFALVRTSNPDSDSLQAARLETGETVAERVARTLCELGQARRGLGGMSAVGAVVGATKAGLADAARLRALMPDAWFLVPGIGAQGGDVKDLAAIRRAGGQRPSGAGLVVNASRSVLYPEPAGADWRALVRAAAEEFAASLNRT